MEFKPMDNNLDSKTLKIKEKGRGRGENILHLEEQDYNERLTQLLKSEKFLCEINKLPESKRKEAIGLMIKYSIIHQDGFEYDKAILEITRLVESKPDCLDYQYNDREVTFVIKSIAEKLGITNLDDDFSKDRIVAYLKEKYIDNGYLYHCFNGVLSESIEKYGVDPNLRIWDSSELDEINDIGNKIGYKMLLGWSTLNCKGKTSVSDNFSNAYRYATASPEWFAQFIAEGFHIPPEPHYDKKAFYKRDYIGAKRNIELFLEKSSSHKEEDIKNHKAYPNMTIEDRAKIMQFFEKYWALLAGENSEPKMALIKRQALGSKGMSFSTYLEYLKFKKSLKYSSEGSLIDCVSLMLSVAYNDTQTEKHIPPSDIKIVSFPNYSEVYS